jgi:hypothetical protein
MTGQRTPHHIRRNQKKNSIPLSNLLTLDVVKTVLDNPRRLEELLRMLEDTDRSLRGRAAATLAQLSESHPARLSKITERLIESLRDDSAYVRWNLVYILGQLSAHPPCNAQAFLEPIVGHLDDSNRIVRVMANKVLLKMTEQQPEIVQGFFNNLKRDIPLNVERCIQNTLPKTGRKPVKT